MMKVSWLKRGCAAVLAYAAMGISSAAQTFTNLASFDVTDGQSPYAMSLAQGSDGNFYGTTYVGGASGQGTVFRITPEGELTTLHSFCRLAQCADGRAPQSSLVQGTNGMFYGTTDSGGDSGANGVGTVFKMSAAGKLTTVHNFEYGTGGDSPLAGLIQGANGNFYGTTEWGGANGAGTVFEISASGAYSILYNFCSLPNCADGKAPQTALIQGRDGNFFGITSGGEISSGCPTSFLPNGCGTAFKITPAGNLTTLYSFCSLANCADGSWPASLLQTSNGNLYGTTTYGGANCNTTDFGCGTVFEITKPGRLTTLYNFCSSSNCADGRSPFGSLIQATDGNLYGTTELGGTGCQGGGCGFGTVFEITPAGTLTTLYSFCSVAYCTDGFLPLGGLVQATNGIFYGTTEEGGTRGAGNVFSLDTGLAPFVSFIRNPAKVGQQFGILGYGLTGTTSVSLNGVPANFTFRSDTLLTATVPAGATSGYVTVTTPGGTLTSNVPFQVIQ